MGIGPDGPQVVALVHGAVAAVVSPTAAEKFEISRANVLAHQRVMERVMEAGGTVLPVKFNTIAQGQKAGGAGGISAEGRIIQCVLDRRQEELATLLSTMRRYRGS